MALYKSVYYYYLLLLLLLLLDSVCGVESCGPRKHVLDGSSDQVRLVDTFGHAQADPQLIGPLFNIILMEAAAMRPLDTVNVAIYYYHRARYH